MILKKSYWAKWLENNRRRSWTFLLCLVMALFCGPLYLMVVLTGLQNNYANDSVYKQRRAAESLRELIQSRITDVIGFSFIHVLFAAFFAILFAVQGFCWLYSRRKTDLYFSVPESLKKRYMLICGNGILVYSFSTLTALLLDWIIGAAFHGMTRNSGGTVITGMVRGAACVYCDVSGGACGSYADRKYPDGAVGMRGVFFL